LFRREKRTGFPDEELLSVYRDLGVIPKSSRDDNHNKPSEDLSGYQLVTKGALVTNKMKAWQGSIAISRYRGIVSPAYYVYTPQSAEHDQFLHYLLRSAPYIALYGRISKGVRVNQWDLEHEALRNIPVLLPDLGTQRQIADFLDRETVRIDLLIEKKQRFLDLLTEKRFATTSSLLTGEMFSSQEQKACSIPWLDSIPSDWIEARMKDVCTQIIDCKNRTPEPVEDGMYLVVRTTCVRDGKFNEAGGYFTDEASYREWTKRGRPQENDVIFTREAPVGEACLAPTDHEFCLGQRTMIYRPNLKKVLPEYIVETIYSSIGKSYIGEKGKGSTVGHLRVPEVYNFPCLLPPLPIQREILAELDRRTGHFVALQKATLSSIDRLKEYRSALITAAVTGQIDVASHSRSGTTERTLDALQEEF
jgi:type I restriction enzyme S subunit